MFSHQVDKISQFLEDIAKFTPKEFARKSRSLLYLKQWKATEYRQMLLYTGPVVLKNFFDKDVYNHYLTLHVACRILSNDCFMENMIDYAEELLNYFVTSFEVLYGKQYISHNVHGLYHLVQDVKIHGNLNRFSAFPFENYLQHLKKYIRKGDKPLQQLKNRHHEIKSLSLQIDAPFEKCFVISEKSSHHGGPVPVGFCGLQFKKINSAQFFISTDGDANNCVILKDGSIVIVRNIITSNSCAVEDVAIYGHYFHKINSLYEVPCASSEVGIYSASKLSHTLKMWKAELIDGKCFRISLKDNTFAIFTLLYSDR